MSENSLALQSNASGWSNSTKDSEPLPLIKEQESSPFNHTPTEVSTQVRTNTSLGFPLTDTPTFPQATACQGLNLPQWRA